MKFTVSSRFVMENASATLLVFVMQMIEKTKGFVLEFEELLIPLIDLR